jgi:large subunit ribosomal protein L16
MLMPKKTKYRKVHRGRLKGWSKGARTIAFGDYGLVALAPGYITARQIESIRVAISRKMKKEGESFFRIFPSKPMTKKPAEVRMGGGKGAPEFWVAPVKRGRIVVEVAGVDLDFAKDVLRQVSYRLPIATRFVVKGSEDQVVYK